MMIKLSGFKEPQSLEASRHKLQLLQVIKLSLAGLNSSEIFSGNPQQPLCSSLYIIT